MLTDPTQPTRIGNSVCRRDTIPDLSYCRYVHDACWSHTHQSLGSDHYILTMQHSAIPDIEDLSQWTDQLLADLDGVTASISTTANHPAIDSRLAHLQAAKTSLTNRWNKQRHNRRLHRRLAYLDREIETHTTALARQQWVQLYSGLSSQLGCKQSWHLLRHLVDPTSAKLVTRQQLQRVIRAYPGDTSELMADLAVKYIQFLPPVVSTHAFDRLWFLKYDPK
ncbi:hypothetical protein MTO96_036154 [Rhipicephalus appendiculatus]